MYKQNILFICVFFLSQCISLAQEYSIPYQEKDRLPIVEVVIENEKYNFLFDTGAGVSVIDISISKEFDKARSDLKISDVNKVVNEYTSVLLPKLSLSGLEISDLEVVIYDFSMFNNNLCDTSIHGIIGRDIMEMFVVEINPFEERIRFIPKEDFIEPKHFEKLSFRKYFGPRIKVKVGNKKARVLFDTGSDSGLKVADYVLSKRLKFTKSYKSKSSGSRIGFGGISKTAIESNYLTGVTIQLGKLKFPHEEVLGSSDRLNNMGFSFIKQFVSILDIENKKIYIEPASIKIDEEEKATVYNPSARFYNDGVTGEFIVREIPIEPSTSQLKLGDEVLSINNKSLEGMSNCDLKEYLKSLALAPISEEIHLEIIRDARIKNIIIKRDL